MKTTKKSKQVETTIHPKIKALSEFLGVDSEEITEEYNEFQYGNESYRVLTDSEADDAWDEYMDSYIDECVLSELPKQYRKYFDADSFKQDCSVEGRGHSLAGYDGVEDEEIVDGVTYYIYRIN